MVRSFLVVLAVLALAMPALAQVVEGPVDAFQIRYAANLNIGDSVINMTNAGTEAVSPTFNDGYICANLYVFAPDQQEIACCACKLSPNSLFSSSVKAQLTNNPLTQVIPDHVTLKVVATRVAASAKCDPAAGGAPGEVPPVEALARGLRIWGTTLHALPTTPASYGVTETSFLPAQLSVAEYQKLTSGCWFIGFMGSGHGVCAGCTEGGRAAVPKI